MVDAGIRALSTLISRAQLGSAAGLTFLGKRNFAGAMGYKRELTFDDYYGRYRRNSIAARVVDAFPSGTWRGPGGELVEDPDPKNITDFEKQWKALSKRLKIWPKFKRADVLAGIGRYSVVYLGLPGSPESEAKPVDKPEDFFMMAAHSERHAEVKTYETDVKNQRYGQPKLYVLKEVLEDGTLGKKDIKVHYSRIIHISDGLLEDNVFGLPRLERVWNNLDDLDKLVGGGSEAFWLRAHQGFQLDLDKDLDLKPDEEQALNDEANEFMSGFRRFFRSRGVKMEALGSDVADFGENVESVLSLVSAGTGIPKRILIGSERGQLASEQDRVNWAERVQDRRNEFAGPLVVEPFVERLMALNVLPTVKEYSIYWPQIYDLSDDERAKVGARWAEINQKFGGIVVEENEIRDHILGLGELDPEIVKQNRESLKNKSQPKQPFGGRGPGNAPTPRGQRGDGPGNGRGDA